MDRIEILCWSWLIYMMISAGVFLYFPSKIVSFIDGEFDAAPIFMASKSVGIKELALALFFYIPSAVSKDTDWNLLSGVGRTLVMPCLLLLYLFGSGSLSLVDVVVGGGPDLLAGALTLMWMKTDAHDSIGRILTRCLPFSTLIGQVDRLVMLSTSVSEAFIGIILVMGFGKETTLGLRSYGIATTIIGFYGIVISLTDDTVLSPSRKRVASYHGMVAVLTLLALLWSWEELSIEEQSLEDPLQLLFVDELGWVLSACFHTLSGLSIVLAQDVYRRRSKGSKEE